ncbi:MAG: alpha/beta fold hydrolase [Pseudomonadota bacterium]
MRSVTDTRLPVVLLHGLGRTSASMWLLARRLSRAGFHVMRIGYDSTHQTIEASVADVRRRIVKDLPGPVHLVGHSLGGLIAARILRDGRGSEVERAVQIGSPNLGSRLAGRMGGVWPARRLCGPALLELSSAPFETTTNRRIGAIAGTLGAPGVGLTRPHDGAVTLRSAWAGAGHRAAVPVLHTLLPLSAEVARLTLSFLSDGTFGTRR